MNWRSTLIWVVLALAVGAVVYFGVLQPQQNPVATATPAMPTPVPVLFPDLTADRVTALRAQAAVTATAFALVRGTDGVWRITEGVVSSTVSLPAPADPTKVSNLLQQLVSIQAKPISGTADLRLFGLLTPTLTLTFTASSGVSEGQQYELRFGVEPVVGRGYYAQKGGTGEVYVVPSSLVAGLMAVINMAPVQPTPTPTAPPTPEATATEAATAPPASTAAPPPNTPLPPRAPDFPPTPEVASPP